LVAPAANARTQRLGVAAPRADQPAVRHLRYRFEASNRTAEAVRGARLWAYLPALETATQRLLWVDASHPAKLSDDKRGNAFVEVALPPVAPRGAVTITLTAAVAVAADPAPRANAEGRAALGAEPFVEVDAPAVTELAAGLRRDSAAATARAVFDAVVARVRPAGFEPRDLGALHALRTGRGDCSEMTYAFVALARAAGLPARPMGGWVLGASALLAPSRYHNWAEYHDGVTWRVADPLGRRLDQDPGHYLATHVGGVATDHALTGVHRFRTDAPGLAVRMLGDR
jgi:transglutaminase-like putative cysteine protease